MIDAGSDTGSAEPRPLVVIGFTRRAIELAFGDVAVEILAEGMKVAGEPSAGQRGMPGDDNGFLNEA